MDAKFRVLNDGGVIVGNDLLVKNSQTVDKNLSVGGNETITGGLTVNGSGGIVSKGGISVTGNANVSGRLLDTSNNPLFKVVTRTIDNISIGVNAGAYPSVLLMKVDIHLLLLVVLHWEVLLVVEPLMAGVLFNLLK